MLWVSVLTGIGKDQRSLLVRPVAHKAVVCVDHRFRN